MIIIIILVGLVNNSVKFKDIYDPGLCKYFFVDILISTPCFTEMYVDKLFVVATEDKVRGVGSGPLWRMERSSSPELAAGPTSTQPPHCCRQCCQRCRNGAGSCQWMCFYWMERKLTVLWAAFWAIGWVSCIKLCKLKIDKQTDIPVVWIMKALWSMCKKV